MTREKNVQMIIDDLYNSHFNHEDRKIAVRRLEDTVILLNAIGAEYSISFDGRNIKLNVEPKLSYNRMLITIMVEEQGYSVISL